jgi:putative flippase GtrA
MAGEYSICGLHPRSASERASTPGIDHGGVLMGPRRAWLNRAVTSRFIRYASVGAVATAVHYALLVGLVESGLLAAPLAAALGAWVGAQVAYAGNARFTFEGAPVTLRSWWRFQITAAIGAAISYSLVAAGVRLGLHYLLAQAAATLLAMLVTYEINRRWSFASPTPGRG